MNMITARLSEAQAWIGAHEVSLCVTIVAAVALLAALRYGARRFISGRAPEDVLTIVAAGVASAVALTGMYQFFITFLPLDAFFRIALVAVFDLTIVTEAFRARRNMREFGSAGVDGAAMWWVTVLEAVLSAMPSRSFAEAAFRLSVPVVAAWLWHRGLSLERRRRNEGAEIQWRFTFERVLVRLGLAEPAGRTVNDVAAARRLLTLARAAKRLRWLNEHGARAWRLRLAGRSLEIAAGRAVEHAHLASESARQTELLALLDTLCSAASLADIKPTAPWARRLPAQVGTSAAADAAAAPELPAAARVTVAAAGGRPGSGSQKIAASGAGDQAGGTGSGFPSAAAAPARRTPRPRPASDQQVDSLTKALGIVAAEPDIKGAELGRRVGVCERQGRNLLTDARALLAAGGDGAGDSVAAGTGSGTPEAETGSGGDVA